MKYFNSHPFRQAIGVAVTVLLARFAMENYSYSHEGWILIAAFVAGQTTRGTPFKQSIYFTVIILLSIMFSAVLMHTAASGLMLQVLASVVFIIAGIIVFYSRPLQESTYFYIILFPLILLIDLLMPYNHEAHFPDRFIDILIGAVIGVVCAQVIFPVRPYKEFAMGLSPILKAFASYTSALGNYLLTDNTSLHDERVSIELTLLSSGRLYPEWVFEAGYNPGLRSGYRYFLVNLERISELLFSLDYLIGSGINSHLSSEMRFCFAEVVQLNGELIQILAKKLNGELAGYSAANFTEDIDNLEVVMQKQLPGGLELLSFTQENIQVVNFARDLKDMRALLLQLLLSLPA